MTDEAIARAVDAAVRQAFLMGQQAARDRAQAEKLRGDALEYGRALALPVTRLAMDEAREQAFIQAHGTPSTPATPRATPNIRPATGRCRIGSAASTRAALSSAW